MNINTINHILIYVTTLRWSLAAAVHKSNVAWVKISIGASCWSFSLPCRASEHVPRFGDSFYTAGKVRNISSSVCSNRPSESDAHYVGHLTRYQHCLPFLLTHEPRINLWSADWRYRLCTEIFTYSSWLICFCGSTKTCWWSFLSSKWQRSSSFSLVLTS